MRDTQKERQRQRQSQKQAPCREPDVGLDPESPRSHPGLKAVPNCWATGTAPVTPLLSHADCYVHPVFLQKDGISPL